MNPISYIVSHLEKHYNHEGRHLLLGTSSNHLPEGLLGCTDPPPLHQTHTCTDLTPPLQSKVL